MLRTLSFLRRAHCRILPSVAIRRCVSRCAVDVELLEPVPPSRFEEMIARATPHFLGDEALSRCFPPCTTGARRRAFQATARKILDSGFGVLALDPTGNIVGGVFACPLHRDDVIGVDIHSKGDEIEDPQEKHILRFLTLIHQRLDLFSVLGISEIVDIMLMFVEKPFRGQGLATRMVMAIVKQAAERGFLAAKGESTSLPSAGVAVNALRDICSVPFTEYKFNGETIFANAAPPDDVIVVRACRLQKEEPFYVLLTESEVNEARRNYLAHYKNI